MLLSEFDYNLTLDMIAQEPLAERDTSKLLVLHRDTEEIEHRRFCDITEYLRPGDLLVMNNTQVTALRLHGEKPTGAKVEALMLRDLGHNRWDAMVKPGRRVDVGTTINFPDGLRADVVERTASGGRILDFGNAPGTDEAIRRHGEVPLPPYITTALGDASRYQTVYAELPGSAAAPTAGFHFTPNLLSRIRGMGVETAFVTLHVGIATFRPVRTENIEEHEMHTERISITADAAEKINSNEGRIISVGTTSARALESAAVGKRKVAAFDGETNIFIKPGYEFKILDGLITNFHMPKSTLMVLVSAFAGRELIMRAYQEAKEQNYRFLSFGDAMFII
ncbi:MAG TPA: tRNA preQ1(34) S-adenosylmethionine ribosyltransferase-isomerase QueA [Armatimonadota bacterium]|jgi:S-adenosylmethionine:tRNA ribosyltransferase-isomerase